MVNPSQDNSATNPLNFFNAAFVTDPYPLLSQARTMGAVVPLPVPFSQSVWLVTRLAEAVQVLKDDGLFTVDPASIDGQSSLLRRQSSGPGFFNGRSMISVDEPDHRRLRTLVSKAFTPRYIEDLRPWIQQLAAELLDRVQDKGSMDLINDYAYPLPINVISYMLGVPQEDRDQIREWSEAIATASFSRPDNSRYAKLIAFAEYTKRLVAEKRRKPQDDLISQLVQIEEAGDRLDEDELLSMVSLLIFAGHETTSNLIGNGMLALFDHPTQLEKLKTDPALIPTAIEEMLRFCGPVVAPAPRFARADTEIGGQGIRKGDLLLIALASADRDATQFTDPDDIQVARALNRHIAFGNGIHYCLGAPLARLEGQIAFATLLQRMPNIQLAIPRDAVAWHGSLNLRGISSLPVTF